MVKNPYQFVAGPHHMKYIHLVLVPVSHHGDYIDTLEKKMCFLAQLDKQIRQSVCS